MSEVRTMVSRVQDYLAARRQMGFALGIAGRQLLAFARFSDQAVHCGTFTLDLAVRWAQSASRKTPLTWERRLEVLRPFARYCSQFEAGTEMVPLRHFGPAHRRLVPHIYAEQEIASLLAAARHLSPAGGLRPLTYYTLFGLLAATGLRVSEARLLKLPDFDFEQKVLTVRQTKFRKSRLVPLDATVAAALRRYIEARQHQPSSARSEAFFISERGAPLGARTINGVFEKLRAELDWTARGGHPRPRIHDLRHTFICRSLLRSYQRCEAVDGVIDAISTYVGHAKVSDTYWYVTAVPEIMAAAAQRFSSLAARGEW